MPIPAPNLDDRTFADLVEEAQRIVRQRTPDWTDLTPSDPGVVLIELFAHLTDVMLYRLNRLPEKAYVEFLRLIGVDLLPPGSARATLEFTTERPAP
jgi:predicted phage baseplate assembly protein